MISLPALKPDGAGGYNFCPKCAIMWVGIACLIFVAYRIAKTKGVFEIEPH